MHHQFQNTRFVDFIGKKPTNLGSILTITNKSLSPSSSFTLGNFTFTFLTQLFHIKGDAILPFISISSTTTAPTMAQSSLMKRLGGKALVDKYWQEMQEDKNGQDKRDKDKVGFFACLYLIITLILFTTPHPHHHHHHQQEHDCHICLPPGV